MVQMTELKKVAVKEMVQKQLRAAAQACTT